MSNSSAQRSLSRLQTLRGMRLWNLRGAFSAVHSSITTGAFTTGYALHLGASSGLIGLLSAAPSWGGLLQVFSPLLIERLKSRKLFCLVAFGISFAMWLPVAALPFLVPEGAAPWSMIVLITIAGLASAVAAPANSSWMTDLVPGDIRGRFVARQQSIIAAVGLIISLSAGAYLDLYDGPSEQQTGFVSLFVIAVAFGMAAITVWSRIPEPPKEMSPQSAALKMLSLPFQHLPFRRFMLIISLRTLIANLAAPFFAVYMLQTLAIPYSEIALFTALQTLSRIAMNPLWGYLGDKRGYLPVLIFCSAGLAFYPLWWVFATPDNYWVVVPLAQVWGGMASAGIPTARFNLMTKIAPEANRSIYIGCYSALSNIGSAVGAILGGAAAVICVTMAPTSLFGYPIENLQYLFLGGFILRLMALGLLTSLREEESTSSRDLLGQVSRKRPLSTIWHLVRLLNASDPTIKAQAARDLGETRNPMVVDELAVLLDDSDRKVRREAVRALGNIGDEKALSPLLDKIGDPSDIAEEAVEALGAIRTPLSLNILVTLLYDERTSIRKNAVLALGDIGDERARAGLKNLLKHEKDRMIIIVATETLSRLGDAGVLPELRFLLQDSVSDIERKTIAQSVSYLLDVPKRFYRLQQAEPMMRDRQVARIFASTRRRLVRWRLNQPLDAPYYETQLHDGLQRYERQAYNDALEYLHRVVLRFQQRLIESPQGVKIIEVQRVKPGDNQTMDPVQLLQSNNTLLRLSTQFLDDLYAECEHRNLYLEEFLLGVMAYRQAMNEMLRMAR